MVVVHVGPIRSLRFFPTNVSLESSGPQVSRVSLLSAPPNWPALIIPSEASTYKVCLTRQPREEQQRQGVQGVWPVTEESEGTDQ